MAEEEEAPASRKKLSSKPRERRPSARLEKLLTLEEYEALEEKRHKRDMALEMISPKSTRKREETSRTDEERQKEKVPQTSDQPAERMYPPEMKMLPTIQQPIFPPLPPGKSNPLDPMATLQKLLQTEDDGSVKQAAMEKASGELRNLLSLCTV